MSSNMIFNRTNEDVLEAKRILNEKLKIGLEITEEERQALETGIVTINTINRIEDTQKHLFELFIKMGYQTKYIENKHWENGQFFTLSDLERVIKNCSILKNAFFIYNGTITSISAKYKYEEFNKIEKIIYDMDEISKSMISNYRICGDYFCGEDS